MTFSLLGALKVTLEYCGESIMKLSNLFYHPPMLALRQTDITVWEVVQWILAGEQQSSNREEDATESSNMLFRWWTLSSSYITVK